MGRRGSDTDEDSVFEDMFELFLLTPAWVGPIVAGLTFALFHYVAPLLFPAKPQGEFDPGVVLRDFFPMIAWLLAGFTLLIWMVAELVKLIRRGRNRYERSVSSNKQERPSSVADAQARSRRPADAGSMATPLCPVCNSKTVLRQAKHGPNAGSRFFGCSRYPDCKGIVRAG